MCRNSFFFCHCCMVIYMFMQKYTYICWIHTDAIIRTHEGRCKKTSLTIFLPLTLFVRFRKGCVGFTVRGSWRPNINCNILTPLLWPSRCVFLVLQCCSTGGLGPTAGCWLSLLHLISIFSGPQLIRAPGPFGLMWLSLPHLVYNSVRSSTQLPPWASNSTGTRTQFNWLVELNSII